MCQKRPFLIYPSLIYSIPNCFFPTPQDAKICFYLPVCPVSELLLAPPIIGVFYQICRIWNTKILPNSKIISCLRGGGCRVGFYFGMSVRRSSCRRSGGRLLTMTQWPLFPSVFSLLFFPVFFFFPYVATFSQRRSAQIKKLLLRKPKNLGVDTFPDPVGHFGAPWRPFWISSITFFSH